MSYQCFQKLLEMTGATVYQVSKATGISASTFTDWKQGRSVPKINKIRQIAEYFGVDPGYFYSIESNATSNTPPIRSNRKRLPIIGEIRAGRPIVTNETLLGYEYADLEDTDGYFFLRICGDSMKNIGMVNGSLVLFHSQTYAEDGDIVACLVDGESATVKRFNKIGRGVILSPENEEYEPIRLSPEKFESGEARILGVAKEVKIKL